MLDARETAVDKLRPGLSVIASVRTNGAFGAAGSALVPAQGINLPQGQKTFFTSGTQMSQPLTQLIRFHAANQIAAAEAAVSSDDLKKAENEVALQVHSLYFSILIARLQKQAAEQQTAYAGEHLRESEEDVRNGNSLSVAAIQGRAGLLESQQSVLTRAVPVVGPEHRAKRSAGAAARYATRLGSSGPGEL